MKPRLKRAVQAAALIVLVAYVLSAWSGALHVSTQGATPGLPTDALSGAAVLSSMGALFGAVVYVLVQARRRSRLGPPGAVAGGVLGIVASELTRALLSRGVWRTEGPGEGVAESLAFLWLAATVAAAWLNPVLLLLWGLVATAAKIRGRRVRKKIGPHPES